jgi:hypothetical protein
LSVETRIEHPEVSGLLSGQNANVAEEAVEVECKVVDEGEGRDSGDDRSDDGFQEREYT